ncbi:hypothetical protein FR742_39985 [Nonomuraea sp. C10]|nr:hypothetical protein FR742_39985 [Nonomuraea sp. C10]
MSRTLPPVQAIRAEIDALFTEGRDLVEVIEDVARLGAHLIIQTAVEAEVDAFLGRARYQRAVAVAADDDQAVVRQGHRNGHCSTTVKTTTGPITIARPKLRGTTEKFTSRLFGTGVTRTHALETLVIASFVRGLSVRDVEGALADALGPEAALSKSTVSTICQAIVAEYDAWCRRDLANVELDYLFLDASHFKMHDGQRAEPILAAWGITTAGQPVFVGLAAAGSESTDAWHDFLTNLVARGLRPPLLIISDGAPGLIAAAEQVLSRSLRQRCLVHRSCEEIRRCFLILRSLRWYGDLHRSPRPAHAEVRGVAPASERTSAAPDARVRGATARARRSASCRSGGQSQRDHRAQRRLRARTGIESFAGWSRATIRRWAQARDRARSEADVCPVSPGGAG